MMFFAASLKGIQSKADEMLSVGLKSLVCPNLNHVFRKIRNFATVLQFDSLIKGYAIMKKNVQVKIFR